MKSRRWAGFSPALFFFILLVVPELLIAEPWRFSLSLYHFNIQYVAGGLKGLFPESPDFDLSAEEVEDMIVKESFEPVLDLYLRHPDWHGDIELQGYFIEVLEKRHTDVLEKLKTLVGRGQIEIVSFHYSDQLFLAYPRADMEWSLKLNREVFERNGIPISGVVFTQEGQFGEGMAQFMKDNGFRIALMPKNLMKYLHPEVDLNPYPYYHLRDIIVLLAGKGIYRDDLVAEWSFFGDGELLATGRSSPYLGRSLFKYKPEAVQKYEDELKIKEANGYRIVTITEYINELPSLGIIPKESPPVLDGTWQPDDTGNLFRWMGDDAALNTVNTWDNLVLAENYKSSNKLAALDSLINYASKFNRIDPGAWQEKLKDAWRSQLFAEVSDSTGWTPWEGEVRYSLDNSSRVLEKAKGIVDELAKATKFSFSAIDARTGEPLKDLPQGIKLKAERMIELQTAAEGRNVEERWWRVSDAPIYMLEIYFSPTTDKRAVSVTFPRYTDSIIYSPALLEDEIVEYSLSQFGFDEIALPLSNGLVGLGRDIFVIKDTSTVHVAGIIPKDEKVIRFVDESALTDEPFLWRFYLVFGNKELALDFAHRINVHPVVEFNLTDVEGCGCIVTGRHHENLLGALLIFFSCLVLVRFKINEVLDKKKFTVIK